MTTTTIILIVVALVVLWVMYAYNRLIALVNQAKEAWADISVQLKRRYDLIPNLVETVKGYAAHEKDVLEKVIQARSAAMSATGHEAKGQAENMLTGALKSLFALSEAYPTLKANENFAKLQDELSDTENKIQASRRFYNTNVMDYNTKIEVSPSNIVTGMMNFKKEEFFQMNEAEREPIKVSF